MARSGDADQADDLAVLHHKLSTDRLKTVLFAGQSDDEANPDLAITPDSWKIP